MVLFCWGIFGIKYINLKSHLEMQVLAFVLSADNTNFMISCSKDMSNLFVSSEDSYHIGSLCFKISENIL